MTRSIAASLNAVRTSLGTATAATLRAMGIPCPPTRPTEPAEAWVAVHREPVFVAGRYCKLVRGVSQSKWRVKGQDGLYTSVEEEAAGVLCRMLGGSDARIHASGREDVDVRMLGAGRPFVLEVRQPRKSVLSDAELARAAAEVSGQWSEVVLSGLRMATGADRESVGESAHTKRKEYAALVHSRAPVSRTMAASLEDVKDLAVTQLTPVRVLHRRSHLARQKVVHALRVQRLNAHWFVLRVVTSAGLYVKEFVHGDLGRTTPNLGSLLGLEGSLDILQLDVMNVLLPGEEPFASDDALYDADRWGAPWRETEAGTMVASLPQQA